MGGSQGALREGVGAVVQRGHVNYMAPGSLPTTSPSCRREKNIRSFLIANSGGNWDSK